ncbi:hypothetical protein QVD17_39020 [Tagetes erecta]|uniref:Uncharacterized protein n=1 Tax=Tagetes erecta TaxID=13708 RepID=A0AAD8NET1_TARER|nr:hypothetical protein QVD17_39020 [Tagetes erecta]
MEKTIGAVAGVGLLTVELLQERCPLNALDIGLKFKPTDVELLEHLAAKYGVRNGKPHPFIDEFIPTLDVDDGICCKHLENLLGEQTTYGLVGLTIYIRLV